MNRHHPIVILAACFALAFLFAVTFVCVLAISLPASDGAAGSVPFSDPLVFPIMSIAASIEALAVFPFTYFALRDRPLGKSLGILSAIVFLELVLFTPMNPAIGFLGSFIAYAIGLVVAREDTSRTGTEQRDHQLSFSAFFLFVFAVCVGVLLLSYFIAYRPIRMSQLLIQAAYEGNLPSVRELIGSDADVNAHDGWSGTPLQYAASRGHLEVVQALITAGAKVDERGRMNRTPIMDAAACGHLETVRCLVAEGANVTLGDIDGKSAADLARAKGHVETAKYLQELRAKEDIDARDIP